NKFCGDGLIGLRYAVLATILYVQSLGRAGQEEITRTLTSQCEYTMPHERKLFDYISVSLRWDFGH
ncbi:hypothetical protein, partial [Pseudomonas fragi]|uniref:hypothetical protein n=1 Tax=Pseudomonas fragi TaxID=296 RepID=UPI000BD5123E